MHGVSETFLGSTTNKVPLLQNHWTPRLEQFRHSDYQSPSIGNTNAPTSLPSSLLNNRQQQNVPGPTPQHGYSAPPTDALTGIDSNIIHSYPFDEYPHLLPVISLGPDFLSDFSEPPFNAPRDDHPQNMAQYTQGISTDSLPLSTTPHMGRSSQVPPTLSPPMSVSPTTSLYTQEISTIFSNLDANFPLLDTFGDSTSPLLGGELDPIYQYGGPIPQHQQQSTVQDNFSPTLDLPEDGFAPTSTLNLDFTVQDVDGYSLPLNPTGDSTHLGLGLGTMPEHHSPVPQHRGESTTQNEPFPSSNLDWTSTSNPNWYLDYLNVPPSDPLDRMRDSTWPLVAGGLGTGSHHRMPSVLQGLEMSATQPDYSLPLQQHGAIPQHQDNSNALDEMLAMMNPATPTTLTSSTYPRPVYLEESSATTSTEAGPKKKKNRARPEAGKKPGQHSRFVYATTGTESERQAQKRRRDSSDDEDGREAKRSWSASDGVNTGPSHTAMQLSSALPRGDGEAISHRRQVDRESTDTHVPEPNNKISAASNRAGAPTRTTRGDALRDPERRRQEKSILQAAKGSPAPDLHDLVEGKPVSLNELQKKIYHTKQICRHTHDGVEYCGRTIPDASNPLYVGECSKHYADFHPCCAMNSNCSMKEEIACAQAGCRETYTRSKPDRHIQTKLHLLADMRFLRFVCPDGSCTKTVEYVPGSWWYEHALTTKHRDCARRGAGVYWKIVDEEPDMSAYVV